MKNLLRAASIGDALQIINNAHEHHEWLVHPVPEQVGMDKRALLEIDGLLKQRRWPDGLEWHERDKRERTTALVAGHLATAAAAQGLKRTSGRPGTSSHGSVSRALEGLVDWDMVMQTPCTPSYGMMSAP